MGKRLPDRELALKVHPLLERQWSFDEFTLLYLFLALLGCGLSLGAMVLFGGWALIVGPVASAILLVGGVLLGLAETDRALTVALWVMGVGAVIGFGSALYLRL